MSALSSAKISPFCIPTKFKEVSVNEYTESSKIQSHWERLVSRPLERKYRGYDGCWTVHLGSRAVVAYSLVKLTVSDSLTLIKDLCKTVCKLVSVVFFILGSVFAFIGNPKRPNTSLSSDIKGHARFILKDNLKPLGEMVVVDFIDAATIFANIGRCTLGVLVTSVAICNTARSTYELLPDSDGLDDNDDWLIN